MKEYTEQELNSLTQMAEQKVAEGKRAEKFLIDLRIEKSRRLEDDR